MQQRRRRQRERRKSSELYQKLIRACKTTTFHMNRAIYILHFSLPFLHDYDAKIPNFTSLEDGDTRRQLSYSFSELRYSALEFNSRTILQHLTME